MQSICHQNICHHAIVCAEQEAFERKRQETQIRESQRWQQMEAERQAEEARMRHIREAGIRGKQNKSSEHFDIISLKYHQTKEGKHLQYKVGRHL